MSSGPFWYARSTRLFPKSSLAKMLRVAFSPRVISVGSTRSVAAPRGPYVTWKNPFPPAKPFTAPPSSTFTFPLVSTRPQAYS